MSNSSKILYASDILGKLSLEKSHSNDDNSENEDEQSSQDDDTHEEDIVDDLKYDLFNLVACNYHPIRFYEETSSIKEKNSILQNVSSRSVQLLIKHIFECEVEKSELGPLCILPEETTLIPREKKIPEPKPETKWERYAKEKGIKKKKRERMLFDEEAQEWKPRYGYKRINNGVEDVPIIEVKKGEDPFADPWEKSRNEKKERISKNLKNQEKNKVARLGKRLKFDPTTIPGIPVDLDNKEKRGKAGIRNTLQLVQHSTQSLGRFDSMRSGEPERKLKGKKRSFKDNFSKDDNLNMKAQLRIVEDKVDKKARGVTNSLAPYEGILPDAPRDSFKQKKGHGKTSTEGKKKKIIK